MPRAASQKTKEELLVENAILKNNDLLRAVLKEELAPFSKVIKDIDRRVMIVEQDVEEIKDTIAPLSAIKKKIWFAIVVSSLLVGLIGDRINEVLRR
jgi:uncharacterized protein YllA (UPF0747 family)